MGGSPWDKYKQPEVVSEGGPWSKYGNLTAREVVDALPAFMTRTAKEKAEVRRNSDNRAFVDSLPKTDSAVGKAGAFSGQYLNSSTFGQIDNLNAAFDTATGTNDFTGQTFSGSKAQHRSNRQDLREANPIAGLVGDIAGYLAPGSAAWKGLAAAGKSIPGAAQLATAISSTGRVPGWLQRIGGSIGLFTADAALFGATVGASNEEAAAGRNLTLSQRGKVGADYAKANLGEMADGLGVEVPSWARSIPVSVVFPVAGSVTERSIKGVTSGGKTITPDRVQAEVLNSVGRAPAQSAAREMAEVIDAGPVSSSSVKTFRFIENALRDAGNAAGFSKTAIRDRIATGFERIREALPTSADGRTPLAVLVEREFADDFGPVVAENLRKFLLRVGLDDAGVTRRFIDDLRQTQVDDFRNMVDDNLGSQSAIDFEDAVEAGIQKKVQSRQAVVDKAKDVGNHGPFADSLREHLLDSDFKGMLAGEASNRGWADVDTFIQNDPWNAANKLQSELGRAESKAFNAGNTVQYSKMLESKEWIQDFLGRSDNTGLPGYNRLTGQIAAESRVRDNIGYTDGFGKKHPGFGPDLKKAARSERDTAQMIKRYEGDTPQDRAAVARLPNKQARDRTLERTQAAARISTGEVLKDQLRGARPGGVNAQGQDVVGLRLADLQTVGMMDALRNVFADAGENIADGVNQLVSRRQFLADIDPRTGSNTTNKQNALATGDEAFTGGLGRSINTNALSDVMLFANGLPPVVSMIRDAPDFIKRLAGPGRAQRAEIANALLQLPQRTGPAPASPAVVPKLTGHSNPNWKNDPRWNEPNLTGQQSPPSEAGFIRPEMLGSLPVRSAVGAAGGAYMDEENRARGAVAGATMLGLGPKAARMADDVITSPSARRVLDGSSEAGFTNPGRTGETIYAKSGRKYSMAEGSTMSKVIELTRQGKTNTQIDEALGLSPGVAAHYRNVAKTGKPPVDLSPQSGTFTTSGGNRVTVDISRKPHEDGSAYMMDVDFWVNGDQTAGRAADMPRQSPAEVREIMSGVQAQLREAIASEQPRILTVKATTEGRRRLFKRMLEDEMPPGYELQEYGETLVLQRAQSESPVLTAGIDGRRRKDMLKDVMPNSQGARVPGTSRPRNALAEAPPAAEYVDPLRRDLTTAGVVGLGLAVPSAPMLYSMYKAEQYKRNQPAVSFQEFVAMVAEEQRRRDAMSRAPSVKPQLPQASQIQ